MRYAQYLRKSRADDPGEPIEATLRRHREALAKCMEAHGIHVAPEDVYEEVASGDSLYARPQMLRLLERVERGDYAGVLCMDIQRLGRGSMSDQGAILDAFKYSHTKIITPNKVYDLSDESDETYTEFETFLGRQEYKMIKRRLRRGVRATVESGGYLANAPYGYEKTRMGKTPTLTPNETEAAFVRQMYELYASGLGCQRIADRVNALGAVPRRGREFSRTTVRAILKNPVYTGKIVWGRKPPARPGQKNGRAGAPRRPPEEWTITQGLHPAIVPQELFDRVQAAFEGRKRSPGFTGAIENPLAGLIVCGNCGRHMQRQADKAGGPILLCQKRGCIASSKLRLVEEQLVARLREEMKLLEKPQAAQAPEEDTQGQILQAVQRQLATARQQDEKLHDLLEQGVYDAETFLARHKALLKRIETLEAAKAQLHPPKKLDTPRMAQRIQGYFDTYQQLTPEERNQQLKAIIQKIVYYKEKGAKPAAFRLEVHLAPLYL